MSSPYSTTPSPEEQRQRRIQTSPQNARLMGGLNLTGEQWKKFRAMPARQQELVRRQMSQRQSQRQQPEAPTPSPYPTRMPAQSQPQIQPLEQPKMNTSTRSTAFNAGKDAWKNLHIQPSNADIHKNALDSGNATEAVPRKPATIEGKPASEWFRSAAQQKKANNKYAVYNPASGQAHLRSPIAGPAPATAAANTQAENMVGSVIQKPQIPMQPKKPMFGL